MTSNNTDTETRKIKLKNSKEKKLPVFIQSMSDFWQFKGNHQYEFENKPNTLFLLQYKAGVWTAAFDWF